MRINTNLMSLNAKNQLKKNSKATGNIMEKLSSGKRINKAADDAAGLAISQKMRAQIRGLDQASRNAQDGISLVQTAEGGLSTINKPHLARLRELAIQSANDTLVDSDREKIQMEAEEIIETIDDIANNTDFNGIKLLNVPDGGKVEEIISKHITVTVNAGERVSAGFIQVPNPANPSKLKVKANFGTISGAQWPDMNLISPNGEKFGFSEAFLDSVDAIEDTTNTSSSKAKYNGWGEGDEEMIFEDPISGKWNIEIRHDGGSTSSTFNLDSNYLINSGKETVIQNDIPGELKLQVGSDSGDNFIVDLSDVRTEKLEISNLNLSKQSNASQSIDKIDKAIETVVSERSKYGSYQNTLNHIIKNVDNVSENLQSAESRISDADIANQALELVKNKILQQSANSMLSQANSIPESVLNLLNK